MDAGEEDRIKVCEVEVCYHEFRWLGYNFYKIFTHTYQEHGGGGENWLLSTDIDKVEATLLYHLGRTMAST